MNLKNKITLLLSCILLTISACKKEEEAVIPSEPSGTGSTSLILDEFENTSMAVVGNSNYDFIVAFDRTLEDGSLLDLEIKPFSLPIILRDSEGNEWDIFGKAITGPRSGEQLVKLNAYFGYWFAWGAMYPGIEIYNGPAYTGDFVPEQNATDWTIPTTNVVTVLGQDGIPAIDEPQFEEYDDRTFIETGEYLLEEDDIVIGLKVDNTIKFYPHRILNWHEVVNDQIGDQKFSLSFCPLTGTSVMWDRVIDGVETTFGVSGILYNGNVITFDRSTSSLWSQMKQSCVNGELVGSSQGVSQVIETKWSTWKILFNLNNLNVLTTETGFSKDYSINPYTPYLQDENNLSYPVTYKDERLPLKERVFGITINDKAKVYQFKNF